MKQVFAFLLLIATAFLLLTVISGIGGIFGRIADTWSADNTSGIADVLKQILYFGGILFVAVIGFALFGATTQSIKFGSGRSGRTQPADYAVMPTDGSNQLPTFQPAGLLAEPQDTGDWYELEQPQQQAAQQRYM